MILNANELLIAKRRSLEAYNVENPKLEKSHLLKVVKDPKVWLYGTPPSLNQTLPTQTDHTSSHIFLRFRLNRLLRLLSPDPHPLLLL